MLKTNIALLSLLTTLAAQAGDIYLLTRPDSATLIQTNSTGFNLTGDLELASFGLCLDHSGKCEKQFIFKNAFANNFARLTGQMELPEEQLKKMNLPSYAMKVSTQVTSEDEAEVIVNFFGTDTPSKLKFERLPLTIDFKLEGELVPRRKDFKEVDADIQAFGKNVFQLEGEVNPNGLSRAQSGGHGTGWFISPDGYALTNLHVLQGNPTCVHDKECGMIVKFKGGEVSQHTVPAKILTCSKLNDFCLIKFDTQGLEHGHFELEFNAIERDLFSLGFPGDRMMEVTDDETENTESEYALTYSFGSPIGLIGTGIASSVFISQGASGSPLINMSSKKAVGILSNGLGVPTDGMPGAFRTLHMIERDFKISAYLDGSNQKMIDAMIARLETAQSKEEAWLLLEQHAKYKTYYGEQGLKSIVTDHPTAAVRKEVAKYLFKRRDAGW